MKTKSRWHSLGRIRDLEKEWPFWAAFGAWFDFSPVLQLDTRRSEKRRCWERYGVAGETWIFVARRGRHVGVELDGLSDGELLGIAQNERFELLLQLSMGSGDSDSESDIPDE